MTNPYVNLRTNITEKKKTSGQIDEVEKFVQSDFRKMKISDNILFSRYLFLEQLNNQSSCSLSLYKLQLDSLQKIFVF